ncbi:uncharacterized protein PV07_00206 [Cladophialophora immunda]|uniref:Very long-chain fatty acid transport protein n=1 Tax=Cladophialophora immunda TaxID=569365 RepID=A0A0D2DC98_9EURO|nr:uncharacterized protein PV07_00206 [Cladophialophora immunda]KIW33349.1 hypothetical protein PV07_00206 [Cladophialophora immunda]
MARATPVIIGVGDVINRSRKVEDAIEPLELIRQSIETAIKDANVPKAVEAKLRASIDSLDVVRTWTWPYEDLPSDIAKAVNIKPSHTFYSQHSGKEVARLCDAAARRISFGEIKAAIVTGGEALASLAACAAAKKLPPPGWTKLNQKVDSVFSPTETELKSKAGTLASTYAIGAPIQVYPLYENAFRAHRGQSVQENHKESARLYAEFAQVAKGNPLAWNYGKAESEETIGTVTKRNRMICFPYPLLMNAFNTVNLAGACLLTSAEFAKELGIPADRWIYLLGGAGTQDSTDFWDRPNFYSSPSISLALDAGLEASGLKKEDIDFYDFYSCFPIVPKLAAHHLGLPITKSPKPITLLGGLTSFGGAGNNYSMHAITEMVRKLRRGDGTYGAVLANGGVVTYEQVLCLSSRPRKHGPYPDKNPLPSVIPAIPAPTVVVDAEGEAVVETYTVDFSRDGAPIRGHIIGRLKSNNHRFLAHHGDPSTLQQLASWAVVLDLLIMEQMLVGAAATGLLGLYLNAKTQLSEDLRLLTATNKVAGEMAKAEKSGKMSLFHVLEDNVRRTPSAPFLFYAENGHCETYRETYNSVCRMASFFVSKGVRSRDIVAVACTNKPTFIHIWLSLNALGAAPAFVNYNLNGDPLLHCLKVSNASLFIVDDELVHNVHPSKDKIDAMGFETVIFDDQRLDAIGDLECVRPDCDNLKNNLATTSCIFYTSGTTGFPKPAPFALWRWYGAGIATGRYLHVTPNDRFYTCMPLYHGTGSSCFIMCIFQGACFCLGHKFSVSRFWEEVRSSRATLINYVGETLRYLLTAPPSAKDKDNFVHSAYGNGLRPDVWEAFRDRFGIPTILEFYGASEATATMLNYNRGSLGVGSVGRYGLLQRFLTRKDLLAIRVDNATEQEIRNPKTGLCEVVGADEPGELLMRIPDPILFSGYYNDPAASKKKTIANVLRKGDLYFRSGDLMRFDSDGWWYFVDRLGDTFRWRSENVSTTEVAGALSHYPAIVDVAVYGVSLPKHDGRAGCAAIVTDTNAALDMAALAHFAKQSLPKYAVPLFVRLMQELPKTENNKQVKVHLKKEGVEPGKVNQLHPIYWLKGGVTAGNEYVRFTEQDWRDLESGRVKL